MCSLDKYLIAVAKRKPLDKNNRTNVAILMQLQNDDVPRLLEIITELNRALGKVIEIGEGVNDDPIAEEMLGLCLRAHLKVAELADGGSHAKWGPPDVAG